MESGIWKKNCLHFTFSLPLKFDKYIVFPKYIIYKTQILSLKYTYIKKIRKVILGAQNLSYINYYFN